MKKFVLAVLATVLCLASAMAGEKKVVWEKPGMIFGQSYAEFSINKVVFTKEETVVHIHAEYEPKYRIKFAEATVLRDEAGKTYAIRNGKAVEKGETDLVPGVEFWMPESGEADIALHFEPMPLGTKRFDLIESYEDGDFKFWNICDNKKYKTALPDDWKNIAYAKNETLPDAKLNKGTTKVRLQVLNYKPEMHFSMLVVGLKAPGDDEPLFLQFPLSDEGIATAEIPVQMAQQANVGLLDIGTTEVILAPNETVECLMDLAAPENKFVAFKGYLAKTNFDVAVSRRKLFVDDNSEEMLYRSLTACTTPEERIQAMTDWLEGMKKKVNALKITDAAKATLRMQAEHVLWDWRWNFAQNYMDYEIALGLKKYETVEERMQVLKALQKQMPPARFPRYYYYELMGEPYSPLVYDFWRYIPYYKDGNNIDILFSYPNKDGDTLRYNDDLRMAHVLTAEVNEPIAMANLEKIGSEDCKSLVREHYVEQRRKIEEASADKRIHYQELDDVAPDAILETILSRHPDEAVVIDIWATWCGPCRKGHADMAPWKEELERSNTPIVFVYLTDSHSPVNTWMEMIKDIPGEHYYLTKAQLNYIMEQYMSDGFPTYAVYGKDKQQRYLTVGYPGLQKMKEEIKKAL